ncbi:glycerol kinase GlpK [Colwellia psychrerythraea]|uniref:glycerol kinase n=1 Tax=Colwellia psychrerythraea TaxID=28229 RepID=A0A099KLT0_COLPS|nr:glycerol kinase GlpK [Colwellia psychrerythraea]KGJ91175.1 glycerol kinase [Colwellia psychrerythraea]
MILAIDQGTTGTTISITTSQGQEVGRAYKEFQQYYPKPTWVEHDPLEIWQVTQDGLLQALEAAELTAGDISCIGITNQRETTVVWHKETGEPLYNAIVWQCRRSAELCQQIKKSGKANWLHQKTGLMVDAYFCATKLQWLFNEKPELKALAEQGKLAFGTIDSWLMWQLSGGEAHCTDHSNASRTLFYNIHQQKWDDDLLAFFDIPKSILPTIKASAGLFCHSSAKGFLGVKIPITGVSGDQQSALFAQQCTQAGMIKNTYGTGCFMLMYTADQAYFSDNGLLTTIACDKNGQPAYALEGAVFIAGAGVQWLRDQLQLIDHADETEALALSVTDNNGVYFVPAFSGLGAPHWNMQARGQISGLTQGCTKAHIVRATLEAIAFQSYDLMQLMQQESSIKIKQLKVDGGACANNFLMQFQADLLDITINRPANIESTVLGATILAAMGNNIWCAETVPEILYGRGDSFSGQLPKTACNSLVADWHNAVKNCLVDK